MTPPTAAFGAVAALLAGLIYTAATLFLKSAFERGAATAQVNITVNIGMALIVQPLWLLDSPGIANAPLWQPVFCGGLYFLGQICTFTALNRGDVSLATPLLGTKILFVTALNILFFGALVGARWWVAALAATAAVALIAGGKQRPGRAAGFTVIASLASAVLFSLTDVCIQHWGQSFDRPPFLPVMLATTGTLAAIFHRLGKPTASRIPAAARTPLFLGAALLGIQMVFFFFSLVWAHDATVSNVLYSSRSVWSVVAAWTGGHFLGLRDLEAGRGTMTRRLLGSLLLFAAIVLILL